MSSKKNLKKIDQQITALEKKVLYTPYLKPLNLEEEKEKFFASDTYNPQFNYLKIDHQEIDQAVERLQTLGEFSGSPIAELLDRKRRRIIKKSVMIKKIGKDNFDGLYLWGKINPRLEEKAQKIVKDFYQKKGEVEEDFCEQEEIVTYLQQVFVKYDLDWEIKVSSKLTTRASLAKNAIKLRKGFQFSKEQIQGMVHHEIETHYFRRVNGEKQAWSIFEKGTDQYLLLEESLAMANKMIFRKQPYLRSISMLYLAVLWGEELSFRQVYQRFRELGASPKQAFIHVLRAKRGLGDTSQPGSFKKGIVYLQGFLQLVRFLKVNPDFQLADLYLGKIGFFELKNLQKFSWENDELLIPEYFKENYREKIYRLAEFNQLEIDSKDNFL